MKLFSEYLHDTKRLDPNLLERVVKLYGENLEANPEYLKLLKKFGSPEAIPPMMLFKLMRQGTGLDLSPEDQGNIKDMGRSIASTYGSTGFADPKAVSGGLFSRPDPLQGKRI